MKIEWGAGYPLPWAFAAIQIAWAVTAVYFLASMLFTNRIRRRESGGARVLDRLLLLGGYFMLFWIIPGSTKQHFMRTNTTLAALGVALTYLGLSLTLWSRIRLGRYWSGVVALKQDHRLIQVGPYRFVRHPLYSGIILAAFGLILAVTTWNSLLGLALLIACFERRAHIEDALLAAEFGAEFEAYRQRTGRLVPRVD